MMPINVQDYTKTLVNTHENSLDGNGLPEAFEIEIDDHN